MDDRTTSMGPFNTAEAYRLSAVALKQAQLRGKGSGTPTLVQLYSHAFFVEHLRNVGKLLGSAAIRAKR